MDVFKITGFLSALLDIGQNGKGFLFWIRKRIQWRKISNCKWDSADPTEELLIDKFKSSMLAEYREHFLQTMKSMRSSAHFVNRMLV